MRFSPQKFIKNTCNDLKENAGDKILVTVSGGVDSSVSAVLLIKAGLLTELLFIDTGFLRTGEIAASRKLFGKKLKVLNARDLFYRRLKNATDPIAKRELFRQTYFEVILSYAMKKHFSSIMQGTQFHKSSAKRYHNAPTNKFLRSGMKIIEPVKGMTKEQIRLVARSLKLPSEIVNRRPFPGPGLLIRFGGRYSSGKLQLIRKITSSVDRFVEKNARSFKKCYQIFPYLTEEHAPFVDTNGKGGWNAIVLIRAVSKKPSSYTYEPFSLPPLLRDKLVHKIMRLGGVSRVCLDLTKKEGVGSKMKFGGTIEYL